MSETTQAHTPGPWEAVLLGPEQARVEFGGFKGVVVELDRSRDGSEAFRNRCHADASLIAAAPELLDELQETGSLCAALAIAAMHPALADYLPFGLLDRVKGWLVNSQNEAVIRKATGR